jgi:ketosteroid isomerase-like protein
VTDSRSDGDKLSIARSYAAATRDADAEATAALTEPDAIVWHSFDEGEADRATSDRTIAWLRDIVPDLTWTDVALQPTPTGFVWQVLMTGTAPGGPLRAHSCMVVTLSSAGRIARTDEYVDSAQLRPLRSPTS